ncbi:MAG: hypothetical protein ACUVXA_14250 [Candidatus Jordarchaeum sp.]|uniref:hypothetical protein n=1 Tax=Candidatus Jordarchaeum sp. TaxID=2823881 RepID=UPI00404A6D4C
MKFPEVKGSNLEGQHFTLPGDLEGKLNILVIAFQQWHQELVNTWTFFLNTLGDNNLGVEYYELPTISRGYRAVSFMIDVGMRAGIPDRKNRHRTITLYINKKPFREQLQIPNEDTIHLLLVTKE